MKPVREKETALLFGQRLRDLRRRCKMTQQGVADRLQIHRTTYTKYEIGGVTPDQQGLLKLAEIFGVTVDYLLGRDDEQPTHLGNDENQPTMLTLQEKVLVQLFRQLDRRQQNELVARAQQEFRERSE